MHMNIPEFYKGKKKVTNEMQIRNHNLSGSKSLAPNKEVAVSLIRTLPEYKTRPHLGCATNDSLI